MSPEQGQGAEIDNRKQKVSAMLGSVVGAITDENYDFAANTALAQGLISPVDVVEYVHIQGRKEENPINQRRLRDGVVALVTGLQERVQEEVTAGKEQSLTKDDIERITSVMQELQLQEMVENETLAEEPDSESSRYVELAYDWNQDIFSPDLSEYTDEEVEKARNTGALGDARQVASGGDRRLGLKHNFTLARKILEQNGGKYIDLQLLLFDETIAWNAAYEAQKTTYSHEYHVKEARELIEKFASDRNSKDRPITARMLASLDKHIIWAARAEARSTTFDTPYHIKKAREIVEGYASSPERAQAMIEILGL